MGDKKTESNAFIDSRAIKSVPRLERTVADREVYLAFFLFLHIRGASMCFRKTLFAQHMKSHWVPKSAIDCQVVRDVLTQSKSALRRTAAAASSFRWDSSINTRIISSLMLIGSVGLK